MKQHIKHHSITVAATLAILAAGAGVFKMTAGYRSCSPSRVTVRLLVTSSITA